MVTKSSQPAAKTSAKPAQKPATKTPATSKLIKAPVIIQPKAPSSIIKSATKVIAKIIEKPKLEKPVKVKKPKLVRDSFTIPKSEFTVLDDLKQRAGKLSRPIKKSELLRAGIKALAAMSDTAFVAALSAVPTIKTGRPNNKPE